MQRQSPNATFRVPWLANFSIIIAQLAGFAGCIFAAIHFRHGWQLVVIAIAFGILMNSVYSIVHEAEHAMLFANRRWNEAAGIFMAFLFPAPFHLLRQGHLGHHLRNRSDDEAFDLYFDGDHIVWKYLVWYGILTGLYYLLVVLSNFIAAFAPFILDRRHFKVENKVSVDRASSAFLESFNPRHLRWIQLEGIAAILLHSMIIWTTGISLLRYAAMYGTFGFLWSAMQYVHHYRTERHVTRGARNLWIFGPLDALWLNHNWHKAHHEHPTVPWVYLPNLGKTESARRGFLPWAYLRMWTGPRKTTEHVGE